MQPNTIINDQAELEKALAVAKGYYQIGILKGHHSLSGADLKGKAKKYGAKYAVSRRHLFDAMHKAGVKFSETTGKNNKRILVIG